MIASIDIVAHEKIVGVWKVSSDFEKFKQVVELSVNVTTNGDWSSNLDYIGLLDENLLCLFEKGFDLVLRERFAFSDFGDDKIDVFAVDDFGHVLKKMEMIMNCTSTRVNFNIEIWLILMFSNV